MALYAKRKLSYNDYPIVKSIAVDKYNKIRIKSNKIWVSYIDIDHVLDFVFHNEHSYIVDEAYLVVYELLEPWWNTKVLVLNELLVGKLPGSNTGFSIVPRFLEDEAREAGCVLTNAGTALATSDRGLASLYQRHGFEPSAIELSKGI